MKRLLLLMLAMMVGWLPAVAQAWWQPDWQYRKQISVDTTPEGAAISESVGRTPLLVRLHTGNFSFDGTNENGSDLRFVSGDDQTVLNHQIESFDPLMGMALIWVDIPEVMASQKQDIWMYYGNEKAPVASNGQITFDPNYTLVYHFDGAAGAPSRDSTAYTNHAQTAPAGVIDGVSGRAAQFVGTAPLMLPASPSLAVPAAGAFSFSAWVRADQPQGQQLVYARRDGANSFLIGLDQGVPFVEINGQRSPAGAPLSPSTWQHLAVTADGSQVILYVQGRATASLNASLPPLNTVAALGGDVPGTLPAAPAPVAAEVAGAEGATPGAVASAGAETAAPVAAPVANYAPFVGAIDELRLSKIARPAALIYADALAQGAESRLIAYGADEEQSGFGFGALGFLLKAVPMDAWIVIARYTHLRRRLERTIGSREDAADALQETWIRIGGVGNGVSVNNDEAYLLRMATHIAIDSYKQRNSLLTAMDLDALSHIADDTYDTQRCAWARITTAQLLAVLQDMPIRQRTILMASRVDGLTYAQIAKQYNISVSLVNKEMMRALDYLRLRCAEQFNDAVGVSVSDSLTDA